jgi:acyl-CoA hydrolase
MYNTPKTAKEIEDTIVSLGKNGINAVLATSEADAKEKVLSMIPLDKSVMTMTSVTLDKIGIAKEINESGNYNSVRAKLGSETDEKRKREIANAPDIAVGSVHAVTMDGKLMIASNTGSQLPSYAYSAAKVIWVVGTQKIVKDLEDGTKRIYDYVLPLESERAKKAYGAPGSFVSKLLIINKEVVPGRLTVVFVPENIGF